MSNRLKRVPAFKSEAAERRFWQTHDTTEYFDGATRMAPNGMPIPGGHVVLTLADGKKLNLPQTMSGSGIRYANADESFVFWSKGDTAFVEEGPKQTVTYEKCVGKRK